MKGLKSLRPIVRQPGAARVLAVCVVLAAMALAAGCSKVPQAAPELSVELGRRISAIESSHMALLRQYFDDKRAQVDRFIDEQWIPVFAEETMNDAFMSNLWSQVAESDDPNDRLQYILRLAPKLQREINSQRTSMIAPLDNLEIEIERRLRDEYNQARAINQSLTNLLQSAANITEMRQGYLDQLGVTDTVISKAINSLDEVSGGLVEKAQSVAGLKDKTEQFKGRVEEITDRFFR